MVISGTHFYPLVVIHGHFMNPSPDHVVYGCPQNLWYHCISTVLIKLGLTNLNSSKIPFLNKYEKGKRLVFQAKPTIHFTRILLRFHFTQTHGLESGLAI